MNAGAVSVVHGLRGGGGGGGVAVSLQPRLVSTSSTLPVIRCRADASTHHRPAETYYNDIVASSSPATHRSSGTLKFPVMCVEGEGQGTRPPEFMLGTPTQLSPRILL